MTVICAGCQRYLGTKPPFHDLRVSYSLCMPCELPRRRELSTLVVARERADSLSLLQAFFRGKGHVLILIDRRRGERRQAQLAVEVCHREPGRDRRKSQSLRVV